MLFCLLALSDLSLLQLLLPDSSCSYCWSAAAAAAAATVMACRSPVHLIAHCVADAAAAADGDATHSDADHVQSSIHFSTMLLLHVLLHVLLLLLLL